MLGIHDLWLFVASGLLLNLTPGADTLFIATRSAALGWRFGVAAALGICTGCLVHVLAAALGLSAILATSPLAFTVVKWVGAAYLVYMGLNLLLQRQQAGQAPRALVPAAWSSVFVQGFLTNVLNPKVALFFLAFVPQFIAPAAPQKALAFLVLGGIFTFNSLLWCLLLAWLAARMGKLGVKRRLQQWLQRGVGGLFVGLGVRLALSD
ncbi:LysE family translocator [Limnohabitans sp.]|uniref:LysE family translocator n=1 Tax=Limnohabitans sp. TaxID=1907725 RepID=UPI00311EAF1A